MHTGDAAIAALAARQHGVVTTAQLAVAGLGRRAVAHRIAHGGLTRLHRGVYRVGPTSARFEPEMAAVLASNGALSHQSAAAIWGFGQRDEIVHVTVTTDARARRGVRVHRTAALNAVVHNGLPLTTPARTLRDLERTASPQEVERAREQAAVLGLVLEGDTRFPEFTRSEGERRLKALCIVEIDGWRYHRTRKRFEDDRRKDAALQVAGYRVVRITYRRLRDEPYSVTAQLGALLTHQRLSA